MINRFINFHGSLKVLKNNLGFLGESVMVDSAICHGVKGHSDNAVVLNYI